MRCAFLAVAALAAGGVVSFAMGGPIEPPASPVGPSMKTLAEVEARTAVNAVNTPGGPAAIFRITQPGSYYLTGNITGVSGKSGISIEASGVTLDLNGFQLIGVTGSVDGIMSVANVAHVTVKNGVIRDWGDDGVDFFTSNNEGAVLREIASVNNGGRGLRAAGNALITGCTVVQNGSIGIDVSTSCHITDCVVATCGGNGIDAGNSCTISGCTVRGCNSGISAFAFTKVESCNCVGNALGIAVGSDSRVSSCIASGNTTNGIQCSNRTFVIGNSCTGNGGGVADGANILVGGSDSRIEGNNCIGGDWGIQVTGFGNVILRNTCSNSTVNWAIAANNVYGQIVDRSSPASAAVNGNVAAGTTGTSDPSANITY